VPAAAGDGGLEAAGRCDAHVALEPRVLLPRVLLLPKPSNRACCYGGLLPARVVSEGCYQRAGQAGSTEADQQQHLQHVALGRAHGQAQRSSSSSTSASCS
jgi:hypothetical protein